MPAASLIPLRIAVTSDNICPFCFIGLRKLQAALRTSPYTSGADAVFAPQLHFLPYQLDPTLPSAHAVDKRERYMRKFGPRFVQMEVMMKQRGQEDGINFDYDGPLRNTFDSHRLLSHAYAKGGWEAQLKLLEELFPHYFERRGDPGSHEQLAKLATDAQLFPSTDAALEWLKGTEQAGEVESGFERARHKGISGVPFFELEAGEPEALRAVAEIPGAQDVQCFRAILERMARKAGVAHTETQQGVPEGSRVCNSAKC